MIQKEMEQNPVIEDVSSAQELVVDTTSESRVEIERMANDALQDSRRDHDDSGNFFPVFILPPRRTRREIPAAAPDMFSFFI